MEEGQTYERIMCSELSESFLPIAAQTMDEIVRDLLAKYKGKKCCHISDYFRGTKYAIDDTVSYGRI